MFYFLDLSPETLDIELELIETWDSMKLDSAAPVTTSSPDSGDKSGSRIYQKINTRSYGDFSLGQLGHWYRKTKNIPGIMISKNWVNGKVYRDLIRKQFCCIIRNFLLFKD